MTFPHTTSTPTAHPHRKEHTMHIASPERSAHSRRPRRTLAAAIAGALGLSALAVASTAAAAADIDGSFTPIAGGPCLQIDGPSTLAFGDIPTGGEFGGPSGTDLRGVRMFNCGVAPIAVGVQATDARSGAASIELAGPGEGCLARNDCQLSGDTYALLEGGTNSETVVDDGSMVESNEWSEFLPGGDSRFTKAQFWLKLSPDLAPTLLGSDFAFTVTLTGLEPTP